MRLSFKESRMEFDNAANLDRRSGRTWDEKDGRKPIHCFCRLYPAAKVTEMQLP